MRGIRRAAGPAAWLASTAVATAVAWWAVTAVGARGSEPGAVLSESQVATALAAEQAAATPGATTPTDGTTTPPPTTPDAVVRTWTLEGGVVSASCSGDVVSLVYATPASGWRVDAKERGPGARVLVELEREGTEVHVQAVCVGGTPEYTLVPDDSLGSDDESGGDRQEESDND